MASRAPSSRARSTGFAAGSDAPAYLPLWQSGELARRAEAALGRLRKCTLCPRHCEAARLNGALGVCRTGRAALVSSCFPHHGEELCLRGCRGSGTIFFASCNLRCVFCQNFDLSWGGDGEPWSAEQIAAAMLRLQECGCHNINFVTPTHVVPQILEALLLAVERGLRLPLVYNTGGYDALETLALLDGVIDIYMPDFKFWDAARAERYLAAPDYPERARLALREMQRQVGPLVMDADGIARRGLLLRHLVMPGGAADSAEVLRWVARELGADTYLNLMAQYRPCGLVARGRFAEIARRPSAAELCAAAAAARAAGLWRFDPECLARAPL